MPARDLAGRFLLVGVLVAAAAILWVLVGRALTRPVTVHEPPTRAIRPNAIVWADRVFSSRASLAAWLASHGGTYRQWAKLHRVDAAIVEHRRVPVQGALKPPTAATHPDSRVRHPKPGNRAAVQKAPGTSSGSGFTLAWTPFVLLALAATAMLAAAMPQALVGLTGGDWFSVTRRTYLVAVGLSLCVGALIASGH